MPSAHRHLRRLIAGGGLAGHRFNWHHLLGLIESVRNDRSPESEKILLEIAKFNGELTLDEGPGMPHSMPPEALLRSLAVQVLAGWDRVKYRPVIARVATKARWQALAAIAQAHLVE